MCCVLVRKFDDLVFDGWAIARADAFDLAGIHGRTMHVFADQPQGLGRGEGDVAADLRLHDLLGAEAERRRLSVAGLLFERIPFDGSAVEARRRAGLESAGSESQPAQRFAQKDRSRFAAAASRIALFAAVN